MDLGPGSRRASAVEVFSDLVKAHHYTRGGVKGGNWEGGNWDFVDFVDLVNLFNSAEIYKNARRNKETKGAERPCGWFL